VPVEEDEALIHGSHPHGLTLHDGHGDSVELPLLLDSLTHVGEDDVVGVIDVV
jgi:hypothetical protein